jgi:membrane fusion protein (multidrug efflux system)
MRSTAFSRTLRSLDRERVVSRWPLGLGALLLLAWATWFVLGRVTITATTSDARIEARDVSRSLEFELGGRISRVHVGVGQVVRAGQLLVELDASEVDLLLEEARVRERGLIAQQSAIDTRIDAAARALSRMAPAVAAAQAQASAEHRKAVALAEHAEREATRADALLAIGAISAEQRDQTKARLTELRSIADSLKRVPSRLVLESGVAESDRQAGLAELREQAARLGSELDRTKIEVARLAVQRGKLRVLAPVAGRIGELGTFRAGDIVEPRSRVGVLIPDGALTLIAEFDPRSTHGLLNVGQKAELRLDGFAWTEYGSLPAQVSRVASEPRNGKLRIELTLEPQPASAVVLQHGLSGSVEVNVERVSPATLVLRAAGIWRRPSSNVAAVSGTPKRSS